jgi:hypothetical protein
VMGRLATLSDPEYRSAAVRAGVGSPADDDTVPPEGIIDVAIHAKGKTLDDCARALAQALGLAIGKEAAVDVEALVAAIGRMDCRLTIMIDALDEAASGQGHAFVERLIVPLGRLGRVRVLVGCRRSVDGLVVPQGEERHGRLRTLFGADVPIDDLEDEPQTHEDIAAYVRLRLAASSKHRNEPVRIEVAAERVAARAQGSSSMRGSCRARCRSLTGWMASFRRRRWRPSRRICDPGLELNSSGSTICLRRWRGARARG